MPRSPTRRGPPRRAVAGFLCLFAGSVAHASGESTHRPGDPNAEGARIFYLASVVGAGAADARDPREATDDDAPCGWEDAPDDARVACLAPTLEGEGLQLRLRRVGPNGEPLPAPSDETYSYATLPITADPGDDYPARSGTISIRAGQALSPAIRLDTLDDLLDEFTETFALRLEEPGGFASVLNHDHLVIPIEDDDPEVRVTVAGAAAREDAGTLEFDVSLSAESGKTVSVDYATFDGTATSGDDYGATAGSITLPPGEIRRHVAVPLLDDAAYEPEESFTMVLSGARNARLSRNRAVGVIHDDDDVEVSIADARAEEGAGRIEFPVTALGLGAYSVEVDYHTADATAAADEDYRSASGTLTFTPADAAERAIVVTLLDDDVDELDETFVVTVTAAVAVVRVGTATGVIVDDDPPPAVSIADAAGDETVGALVFAVRLGQPSALQVSVGYATADGTAEAGRDYEAVSGRLTFAPGATSMAIRVPIVDDDAYEPDEESFTLTLADATGATVSRATATGTIRDDDLAPPSVAGDLPEIVLCVGGAASELDLADHFLGEELRLSAVSSAPDVATAVLSGSRLALSPVAEGAATVALTAVNDAGTAEASLAVRVVTDPAELRAVEAVLASVARGVLSGVADAVGDRVSERRRDARDRADPAPFAWDGTASAAPTGLPASTSGLDVAVGPGFAGRSPMRSEHPPREMVRAVSAAPFAFAIDASDPDAPRRSWSVWGRGDVRRFRSELGGTSHEGTGHGIHLGADVGTGDWLAGASVQHIESKADYRFARSLPTCGPGEGEGALRAELTGIHPYAARRFGRGWFWIALGAGRGRATVERCGSGPVDEADLSTRLAVLGGRHPVMASDRLQLSVVEEVGMVRMTTGSSPGPLGHRSVTTGQARVGLELAGVAPPDCRNPVTTYLRVSARGDWGDGPSGAGAQVGAGLRYLHLPGRLGLDAGVHALAVHSAAGAEDRGAKLAISILPRSDGTGLQGRISWQRAVTDHGVTTDTPPPVPGLLDRRSIEHPDLPPPPGATGGWTMRGRLAYARWVSGAIVTPFAEVAHRAARLGVRRESARRGRDVVVEWTVARQTGSHREGTRVQLSANVRF